MKIVKTKRNSHCLVCGRRLSVQQPTGDIEWRKSRVDDKGIYCDTCYPTRDKSKPPKPRGS